MNEGTRHWRSLAGAVGAHAAVDGDRRVRRIVEQLPEHLEAADEHRQGRGSAQRDRVGGLHAAAVGQAVREADGLSGELEVRRILGRDGDADASGWRLAVRPRVRLRRREPAPHPGRRRGPGQRQPDPGLEELHSAAPVPVAQHRQRRALRRSRCSGARTRCSTTRRRSTRRRRAGRRSTARSTRARSPCRTTRSRSPTPRSTCQRRSRASASPTRTS